MNKVTWKIKGVDVLGETRYYYLKNIQVDVKSTTVLKFFKNKYNGVVDKVLSIKVTK